MNKTKIKNFSIWARRNLIEVVAYRMRFLGIDENGIAPEMEGSTDKLKLYDMGTSKPAEVADKDIAKRVRLASHIREHEKTSDYKTAYETVVEEIAYTWFNRLIAIRFMEVNDYLPSGVRVLSSESGKREPDIVTQAVEVAEDQGFAISKDDIWRLKDENKLDELFRIMFIAQCKKLNEVLPELFDNSQDDYTEMLLPISFIDDDAFIRHLVTDIDEADFNLSEQGQVEIIGWLYQYYNSEKKDAVFAAMSNKVKVSKENIAAATQLFTPDWIVRYMVENSLGRLWVDGHADTSARSEWKYYLDEAEQTPEVQAQLAEIRAGRKALTPEQIRFIDPCMGSGHILVYAFDVLMQIYLSCGYTERDAAQNIVRNNLWGLDLDKRAYQLAYFAVMMKARQYDRRFLTRGIKPNLSHFQDLPIVNYSLLDEPIKSFVEQFENADTYGSLITVQANDSITEAFKNYDQRMLIGSEEQIEHLINLYKILSQRYDVVCTNPPYMGAGNMNGTLKDYINAKFADYKSDFFSAFVIRCTQFAKHDGYLGFLTPYVWMFIQSYEALRNELYSNRTIETLIQFEYSAFEEATVPICTFAFRNNHISNKNGCYLRLTDFRGGMEVQRQKALEAIGNHNCGFYYEAQTDNFSKIPGAPVAYWLGVRWFDIYSSTELLDSKMSFKKGMSTGDNNRFMRNWYEVLLSNIGFDYKPEQETTRCKWYPINSGGQYRKWYGNNDSVVNWLNDGAEMKENAVILNHGKHWSRYIVNTDKFFVSGLTWNAISSAEFGARFYGNGFIFSSASMCGFGDNKYYILGILNSVVSKSILRVLSPTLNFGAEQIRKIPYIVPINPNEVDTVNSIVENNILISKADWDSFETSWDFKTHPFIMFRLHGAYQWGDKQPQCRIQKAYELWADYSQNRFNKLKTNEEELNRIFIEIYGLQDELTPEVDDKDITVRAADLQRDIRSFVSYAVGCMLGRYSLDTEGLAYAGGDFSDKWVVVSGQYYRREVVEYYVSKELSRVDSLAKIYGFSGDSLQPCEIAPETGDVCTIGSVAQGGCVDTFKYRRGTVKKLYEGICELFVDGKRVEIGSGNTAYDLCSPEILRAISDSDSSELVSRGWKDADRIDWKTIHYSLTTNHYCPDKDNCLPITEEHFFEDDIVTQFANFVQAVFGEDTLEDNLRYVSENLGIKGNGTAREKIRQYFLKEFYKDHCKVYQKRPIYWLFDTGKKNGFKALCYIHRWTVNTVGDVRIDYMHKLQRLYRNEINRLKENIDAGEEIAKSQKRLEKITNQLQETEEYDAKIGIVVAARTEIDLDDGVKVNYDKVQVGSDGKHYQILAKI